MDLDNLIFFYHTAKADRDPLDFSRKLHNKFWAEIKDTIIREIISLSQLIHSCITLYTCEDVT